MDVEALPSPLRRGAKRTDGLATRARILESAGQLFSQHGFGTTTSKAVAEAAGVDLASINYHFGSRDGLLEAVLVEAHRCFISLDELSGIAALDLPAADKLRAVIDLLADRFTREPHWSGSVLARELLNQSPHARKLLQEELPPKMGVVLGILSEITGIPFGDPALVRCMISVMAPCGIMYVAQGRDLAPVPRMQREAMADHLYRFAMAGLEAISADYRG